jgi:methylated-DNA-protein-cysteine methyltransferase-like protein
VQTFTTQARAFYAVIRKIPRGKVATYGQVAELAGFPRRHRAVATALRRLAPGATVPWHRVVGKRSRTTARIAIEDEDGRREQRRRLEREGVRVSPTFTLSLPDHGWLPTD